MAHLHAPTPHHEPNGSPRRAASSEALQRAAVPGVTPAARPADARLLGLPGAIRQQVMLQLQRQHGNRHVQSLIAPQPAAVAIQAEGLADDEEMQAEGEEDELQAEGEEDELQAEGEEDELQAEGASGTARRRTPNVSARVRTARGSGGSLDGATLQRMGGAFGQSFDHVRVHADTGADRMARDLNAKAFTNGSDVFFRAGQYAPGTAAGDHLIAHELTHVVQQGQGLVPTGHQSSGGPAGRTPSDVFEQEAAATADAITDGKPLPGTTPATANVQRKRQ